MRKLTIADITCYLPYGLKALDTQYGNIFSVTYCITGIAFNVYIGTVIREQFIPYLRPLSCLTEEITVNGETFVPMVKLLTLLEQNYWSKDDTVRAYNKNKNIDVLSIERSAAYWLPGAEYLVTYVPSKEMVSSFSYNESFDRFQLRDETYDRPLSVGYQMQLFDKLNEWLIDYRGLINAGLALPLTEK